MENKALISIIMPFKDSAAFIGDCIQSILDQTETNWELIAVNDNSTDASKSIVASYQKLDNRIHLFDNKGEGIIAGLQTAYFHAKGQFITRIDSDDLMPKNRLETHKNKLLEFGKGYLATGKVSFFSDEPIGEGYQAYENWLNQVCEAESHWQEIFKECVIPSPCWMMYQSDFEKCGGFNGADFPEDYDLTFRIWEQQIKVIGCKETLLFWREHPHRTSNTDERLKDNHFSKLKIKYFLKNCYRNSPLILWGAGNRGKEIAQLLQNHQVQFEWITANPAKVGKTIHGIVLKHHKFIDWKKESQHIISFADPKGQKKIHQLMSEKKCIFNKDYFFFA